MEIETINYAGEAGRALALLLECAMADSEDAVGTGHIGTVTRHYVQLRTARDTLAEIITLITKHLEGLSQEVLPTMFENQNVKSLTVPGIGRTTINNRWSCSMPNKAAAMQWLIDNGDGGMVTSTVHPQTLGAYAKDRAMEGKPLPEDLFKVSSAPYVSITK